MTRIIAPPAFDKIGPVATKKADENTSFRPFRRCRSANLRLARSGRPCRGLGIRAIKAKLDTGAKTSALHAWDIDLYEVDGRPWVSLLRASPTARRRHCRVLHRTAQGPALGDQFRGDARAALRHLDESQKSDADSWPIELTLTNRDEMGFRMLVGREAMSGRLIVDPNASYPRRQTQ